MPVALAAGEDCGLIYGLLGKICRIISEQLLRWREVEIVALFLAGTATLVHYPVKRFPHSVASTERVRSTSRHRGNGARGGSRAGVARTCAVAEARAP